MGIIEKYLPSLEDVSKIREKLKECKSEWLQKKEASGGKPATEYMGVNTVRQIIDNAVQGITYWDHGIKHQWREEVHKYDKSQRVWNFDGYVYHVLAYIMIPGLGRREQFGAKVAVGGKDNQDSAYKAAASNALVKAAALFGVGEAIYSKIKIEDEEQQMYEQIQQNPQYQIGQQPAQPQPYYDPNAWNQGAQQSYYGGQQGYYPQQGGYHEQPNYGQQNGYPQQGQPDYFIQGGQQAYPQQGQPLTHTDSALNAQPTFPQYQQEQQPAQTGFDPNNADNFPFNPHPEGSQQATAWDKQHLPPAQPQSVEQPAAISYGAPVGGEQPSALPPEWDPQEIAKMHQHRARLNITGEKGIEKYDAKFLRDEQATQ